MEINKLRKMKVIPKHVSAEASKSYKLSEEELQYYRENGFLVIRRLIDFTELYNYKQHFLRICKGLESPGNMTVVKERSLVGKSGNKEDYINKLQDVQFDEVFATYSEHPRILDIVSQLVGDDVTVVNSMFINKPPGTSEHPPHQDLHYIPFRPAEKIVGTWTAIDDATVENGCLWGVPGSHTDNTVYQHVNLQGALKLYHGIADESVASPHKRVPFEMGPGDTVLLHPLLVHGSGPNTTTKYRKCLSSHYINSHCYTVDFTGTKHEILKRELETELRRRGWDNIDYAEIWRLKSKEVRRKSQL